MENVDWEKANKIFQKDKESILKLLEKETNRHPRVKEILTILAAGTAISAVFLMPGLARILPQEGWNADGYKKHRLKQSLKRLQKQKIVDIVETKDGPVVKITQNGFKKALKYKLDDMQIKRQKSWDKKWRIVVFDIPEERKKVRDEFRGRLKQLGFFPLQESVFVHAFPCFDEIEFLRQIYGVDISATYILAWKIESQENIERFFDLA